MMDILRGVIPDWERFSVYLFIEKKLDRSNTSCYKARFKYITKYFLAHTLTKEHINNFLAFLQSKGLKNSSLNNYIKLLKHICAYLNLTILDNYSYFEPEKLHVEPLTTQEIELLINSYLKYSRKERDKNQRMRAIIMTLALTGARISELLSLTWNDYTGKRFIIRESKTNEVRQIPVATRLQKAIEKLPHESSYIFGTYQGPVKAETVNKELQQRALKVGIQKEIHAHIFRHSYITTQILNKVPISIIQRIVGHASLNSTAGYTHLVVDDLEEAVEMHPNALQQLSFEEVKRRIKAYIETLSQNNQLTITETIGTMEIVLIKS